MSTATVTTGTTTVTESYLYDWAGTRTAKITDGVLTYYLVDTAGVLSQVLAELDHTGALITHYTRGEEIISLSRPGEKHYYLHDGHGSVRALSDADGQVTDTYLFDAFGNLLTKTGTTANDFLYTGEQYDRNTGFYYLRARYMNPSTGTFTQMDAYAGTIFDPVSLHKYLYANANPVMNRDPSGYYTLTEMQSAMMINAIISRCAVSAVVGSIISSLEYVTHGGDFFSFGYVQASMNGFWTGALFGFVFGILGLVLNVFLFSIILVTLSFFTIQYGWERYKSGDHVWGFVYIGIGIIVACGTIFNLVRVLKPYISGGSKGNKPVGDQGKKSDGDQGNKTTGDSNGTADKAGNRIKFGSDVKSTQKLSNQMNQRGWTESMIRDTVSNPYTTRVSTNKATGNPATAFYNPEGAYVVVDDFTLEVVQISDNINPSGWSPDSGIVDPYTPWAEE